MRLALAFVGLCLMTPAVRAGDCCEGGSRPQLLRMIYLAKGCDFTSHRQDPDKVSCEDFVDELPEGVYVIVSNKMDPVTEPAKIWFEGPVDFGQVINVDAGNGNSEELLNRTCIATYDEEGGSLLQRVEFRTSCLEPLRSGEQFGAFLICECLAGPPPKDCCETGRPSVLTMRYTGQDCGATSHGQASSKVICQDLEPNDPLPNVVYVRATSSAADDDPMASVWFEGFVAIGQTIDLSAANAGLDELRNRTYIYTFAEPDGEPLQVVGFCTNCNEPLRENDQFGAYRLVDCQGGGGEGCSQGYWKQPHHFDSWTEPYTPQTPFADVFDDAFPGMTLHQVLSQGGGKLNSLGRKVVAALLNAASPDVSYDLAPEQVIDSFDSVYPGSKQEYNELKEELEEFNNQGCPLD